MSDEQNGSSAATSEAVGSEPSAPPTAVPADAEDVTPDDSAPASGEWKAEPIFGGKAAYALATATGVLAPIGFAGLDVWPLAFIAWVPLILALRGQSVRRATGLGWWSGFLQVMIGFYWLTSMLETFSGFPLPLCVLFAAILSAYQGGRIALLGFVYARAARKGWNPGVVFAGAFALSELVFPLLFPWYYGAAFHNQPLLLQTAELGGPILVSLVTVGINLAIAEVARARVRRDRVHRLTVIAGAGTLVAAVAFGALRMRAIDERIAAAEPVKVGLIQSDIGLHDRRRAVPDSLALTKQAREQGAELVIWSEAAIPSGYDVERHQKLLYERVTRHLEVPAVVGGVLYERLAEATGPKGRKARFYNSAFMVDPEGAVTGRYDKQYLLMFGEYLPLGDTFPILYEWSPNSGAFTPGSSFAPLKHGEHRLATMICYEDIIPGFVNRLVAEGDPDLLVNLTNDRWFQNPKAATGEESDTTEPWQHLALAKLRTIEHRMYLARVSNSGVSAIIDANGRVVVHGGTMKKEALVGEARYMRVPTVYSKLGDIPWWLASAAVVAAGFVPRKRWK